MARDALKRGEPRDLVGTPRDEGLGWSWRGCRGPGRFSLILCRDGCSARDQRGTRRLGDRAKVSRDRGKLRPCAMMRAGAVTASPAPGFAEGVMGGEASAGRSSSDPVMVSG